MSTTKPHCKMSDRSRRLLFATLNERGLRDRWVRLAVATAAVGRVIATFRDLSDAEAARIVANVRTLAEGSQR